MDHVTCEHQFRRYRRWPVKLRYRCDSCGLVTHRYDAADHAGGRPIHRHMSVAVRGVNIVGDGR